MYYIVIKIGLFVLSEEALPINKVHFSAINNKQL